MAPGGVEPPRADSKSAALSTELRGRHDTVAEPGTGFGSVLRSSAARMFATSSAVAASRVARVALPTCGEHHVRQVEECLRYVWLVHEDVQAGAQPPDASSATRASSSTIAPRAVLTRQAPSRSSARRRASSSPCVSSVSGTWTVRRRTREAGRRARDRRVALSIAVAARVEDVPRRTRGRVATAPTDAGRARRSRASRRRSRRRSARPGPAARPLPFAHRAVALDEAPANGEQRAPT